MKVLLVKTSSMGDVVHTLTALQEAKKQRPDLDIDWLIEEDFFDIAKIAQNFGYISHIIPIRFREWRKKKPFGIFFNPHIRKLKKKLRANHYDVVLDAQGLLKSAFLSRLAGAPIIGFDKHSARESAVVLFYKKACSIPTHLHAIKRQRLLFSHAFQYDLLADLPLSTNNKVQSKTQHIVLLHGTTWTNKRYPTEKWQQLAEHLVKKGYKVIIPQNSEQERISANLIAQGIYNAEVLPEQRIEALLPLLQSTTAVISVDTGLAHLAAYLGTPTIMLFGPTQPELTGGLGKHTINIVGEALDTGNMKRNNQANHFSESMSAIENDDILAALNQLTTN